MMGLVDGVLAEHVAVVVGGSRGIGRSIAAGYAAQGATVVVAARGATDLEESVAEVRRHGNAVRGLLVDAADPEGARRPVRAALADFGRVDVLANCVGDALGSRDPFDRDDGFEATLRATLLSAWWAIHEALPHMRAQGGGHIVSIGSAATRFGLAGPGFAAAKHGLVGMTKAVAAAAGPYGITVNCLSPGWTNTSRLDWATRARLAGSTVEDLKRAAESENAQRRILEPTELVGMAILLASPAGGGITGQDIHVDGGYRL